MSQPKIAPFKNLETGKILGVKIGLDYVLSHDEAIEMVSKINSVILAIRKAEGKEPTFIVESIPVSCTNLSPVDQVIKSLREDPNSWELRYCTLTHKPSKVEIWVENTKYLDCTLYSPKINLGIIDRIRLQLAVNRWSKTVNLGVV